MRVLRCAVFVALVGGCAYGVDDFVAGVPDDGQSAPASGDDGADASIHAADAGKGARDGAAASSDAQEGSSDAQETSSDAEETSSDAGQVSSDSGQASSDGGHVSSDAGKGSSDAGVLDPGLGLPGAGGATCSRVDTNHGCQIDEVCRIATPDAGRCESCGACKGYGDGCKTSFDCDTLFQCYEGQCTFMCRLGGSDCAESTCIDVGNGTYGVCAPI